MATPRFGEALHRLLHAYHRALREGATRAGIDLPVTHIRVLKAIARTPECTGRAVGRRLQRDKGQITRLVKELQAEGLVAKRRHPQDSRSRILSLTERGREMATHLDAAETRAAERMGAGLDPDDVEAFIRLADRMAANLEQPQASQSV